MGHAGAVWSNTYRVMGLESCTELKVVTYYLAYFVVLVIHFFISEIVGYTLGYFIRRLANITDVVGSRVVGVREYQR